MAKEIERKFLVKTKDFLLLANKSYRIEQAYLATNPTVRVRVRDDEAFLTLKTASQDGGLSRDEWEYAIPLEDAREMMRHAKGRCIIKTRYLVEYEGHTWEVDVFEGEYEGLMLAEIELSSLSESFVLPPWVGEEVTGQVAYYNAHMALSPNILTKP